MIGDLAGLPILKGLGLATVASPAPKVFTAQKGFETYANRFYIEYTDIDDSQQSLEITPQIYQRLEGPYNRRNIFGAATSYGPVLASNEITRPMLQSILHYAFCGDAPILQEFGVHSVKPGKNVYVNIEPLSEKNTLGDWVLKLEANCEI